MSSQEEKQDDPATWLVYDGECPFCSTYVKHIRLRDSVGTFKLVDARKGGAIVNEINAANLDLDEGMILKLHGQLYHGAECMNRLAMLTTPSTMFNRINAITFRNKNVSRVIYPVLRACRNTLLFLLGRNRLNKPTL